MVKKIYTWKRMPMYIDEWIEFKRRNLVWLRVFLTMQRNKKIVIKRVKKLQKLINEVQKKTKQNRKKM